ncbi:MAG: rRNA maturation RNase YbeY [Peptostreptococcaceae bacterium]|nr:rRNA maturation RNase YbeY [Peptostreptococcaceae bacterium]
MNIIFSEETMPSESIINRLIEAAELCVLAENLDQDRVEISVSFIGEEEMHDLNKLFRNVDHVTDVLSFPQYENMEELPEEGIICLGDVVICSEQALIQADELGHSPEREILYLFVHSMFHLMGYDHMDNEEKTDMREKEETIMTKLGSERQI